MPLRALAAALILVLASATAALAQSTTAALTGIVSASDQPVAGAEITATGSNLTLHARTDAHGGFRSSGCAVGTYELTATAQQGTASLRVDVPSAGASVTLSLTSSRRSGVPRSSLGRPCAGREPTSRWARKR